MNDSLRNEFERIYKDLDDSNFKQKNLISFHDVLKSHYLIADYFHKQGEEVVFGIKDVNMLGSALGRQITGYGNQQKWNKPEEICATLFFGLIKNHAFHDANKRTALLILLYHITKFGRTPKVSIRDFENLAVNVALGNYKSYKNQYTRFADINDGEILFIADFIRRNTRDIDKRFYKVTYHELNILLKRHDCFMEDASGNYVNVYKQIIRQPLFGKPKPHNQKVLQIGFPGWKKTINPKALKEVLKACCLTDDHGIDSQTFYYGVEPLQELISEYSGPLKRLKDR